MNKKSFEKLVTESLNEIPEEFREKLDNVEIVVENEPSNEQLIKMHLRSGHTLLGLYEGIPQLKRMNYSMVLPDKITIFQLPIENLCSTPEEIKEEVKKTVLHEIGHHFGMSEEELRKIN